LPHGEGKKRREEEEGTGGTGPMKITHGGAINARPTRNGVLTNHSVAINEKAWDSGAVTSAGHF